MTTIKIPNSVETIGKNAFKGCIGLTSAYIGSSIVTIGDGAFSGCQRLYEVHSASPIPPICDRYVFSDIPNSSTLYIPVGSFSKYYGQPSWSMWWTISYMIELENISTEQTVSENLTVYMQGSTLVIDGATGYVAVYNQAGILVQSMPVTDGRAEIQLAQRGVYIVKTSNATTKITW